MLAIKPIYHLCRCSRRPPNADTPRRAVASAGPPTHAHGYHTRAALLLPAPGRCSRPTRQRVTCPPLPVRYAACRWHAVRLLLLTLELKPTNVCLIQISMTWYIYISTDLRNCTNNESAYFRNCRTCIKFTSYFNLSYTKGYYITMQMA